MSMLRVQNRRFAFQRVGTSGLHCCVPLCSNSSRYNKTISFHSFPVDPVVQAEWLRKIRRDNFTPTKNTRVCCRHFNATDCLVTAGGLRRLQKGAIPVLFSWNGYQLLAPRPGVWERHPGPESPAPESSETEMETETVVLEHDYCLVPETGGRGDGGARKKESISSTVVLPVQQTSTSGRDINKPNSCCGCSSRVVGEFQRGSDVFLAGLRGSVVSMVKCLVSSCPNRSTNQNRLSFPTPKKRFFSLPQDPIRVKIWLAALRETDKLDVQEHHYICEDHFLPEDITSHGVESEAIPIMPPCLDGGMMGMSWGAEPPEEEEEEEEEEEGHWVGEGDDEEDEAGQIVHDVPTKMEPPPPPPPPPPYPIKQEPITENVSEAKTTSESLKRKKESKPLNKSPRIDFSLAKLTQPFLKMLLRAPDGVLDLRQATKNLKIHHHRRVYDITNVLEGINLIEKVSPSKIKWIEECPIAVFLSEGLSGLSEELKNLKLVEDSLDDLIKSCAHQLFNMTDDQQNSPYAYITHEDVRRLAAFQEQTVLVVKAPEETKLEVPPPKEDGIQVHLKGGKGPIRVVACDTETEDVRSGERSGCFVTLEESRIKTTTLHTEGRAQSDT